jgi:RHS repeat-associated protein
MRLLYFILMITFLGSVASAEPKRFARKHVRPVHRDTMRKLPPIKMQPIALSPYGSSVRILSTSAGRVSIGSSVTISGGWSNPNSSFTFQSLSHNISGAGFSVLSDTCSGSLGPGASCSYSLSFSPSGAGSYSASISLSYTAVSDNPSIPPSAGSASTSVYAQGFDPEAADADPGQLEETAKECGSVINVDSQTAAEAVPIVGTPFSMWYSTEYAKDYSAPSNTYPRYSSLNPEGFSISVVHLFDFNQKRLLLGTGSSMSTQYEFRSGNIWVVSPAADEIYVFDYSGIHLETKTVITGATKYLFTYDVNYKLTKITDSFGNETVFNRTSGVLSSVTAPNGQVTSIVTSGGLITEIENPKGEAYAMTYKSGTDLLQTFTKPGGQVTTFSYDGRGRLTRDLGHGGNFWDLAMTLRTDDRLVSKTSKLGRETRIYNYQYADYGGSARWTETPSDVRSEHVEYYGGGSLEYDDTTGNTYSYYRAIDPRFPTLISRSGGQSSWINGNTSETIIDYAVSGMSDVFNFTSLTETSTTNGRSTIKIFDTATKTYTSTTPEGAVSYETINSYEQPVGKKIGLDIAWTYSYDIYGRLSGVAQGIKNGVTNTYNSAGFLSTVTNARSEQTTYSYDLAGRVTQVTLPDSRVVGYSYDDNGNLVGVTPPSRPEHVFGFNAFELMSSYQPPALTGLSVKNTTYTYNDDKQLTSVIRPDTQTAGYTYNATTGLLSSLNLARGNNAYQYQYRSEKVSRADSADGIASEFTYYGDSVLSETQLRSSDDFLYARLEYGFDSDHRKVSRTLQGNSSTPSSTIATTLNDDNMPVQIGSMTLGYSYPSGRLSSTVLDKISDSRTYDSYGKLESYTATYTPAIGPVQTLYSYTLTRDVMSRISAKSETILGVTDLFNYTYDVAGRLTAVTKNSLPYSSYVYDDNGNRTSGTHAGTVFSSTFDDQDRMLTFNGRVYSYNANGDNTQIDWNITDSSYFSYDALGSLVSAITPSGGGLTFEYDGMNRQVRETVNGVTTARRIYENNSRIAAQFTDAGSINKEFVFGVSINSPEYVIVAGIKYRYIKDHLGSPRLMVNVGDGSVVQRIDYSDLGMILNDTAPGFQPYGFAGGIIQAHTNLTKFGARYYDAETGRWTSKDPIRFGGGDFNLYGYVVNDPINFIDPDGLDGDDFDKRQQDRTDELQKSTSGSPGEQIKAIYKFCKETAKDAIKTSTTNMLDIIKP